MRKPEYSSYETGTGASGSPRFTGRCEFLNKIYETENTFSTKVSADTAVAEKIFDGLKDI